MRRVHLLLVAAVLMVASAAGAQPGRAAAGQTAKAARTKSPAAKPTAPAPRTMKPVAKLKPAVKAVVVADDVDGEQPVAQPEPVKPLPVAANTLLTQYQRVGRDLLLLMNERRAQTGIETADAKLSCAEVSALFRSIKIDDAVKTPESRIAAAALLTELHGKIERLRGVAVSQDCLNNPLAKDCS